MEPEVCFSLLPSWPVARLRKANFPLCSREFEFSQSHQGNISGGSDYMFIPPVMRGLKNYRTLKKASRMLKSLEFSSYEELGA